MDKFSRKAIIKETLKFIKERPGISAQTKWFSIDTRKLFSRSEETPTFDTKVEITDEDTLYATTRLQTETGETFCFLIFGNAFHPGGGYLRGAAAQEESIARRTNLSIAFPDSKFTPSKKALSYPLPEFGGAYIKNIVIFRDSEEDGCTFHSHGTVSNAIIGCAYRRPECEYVPRKKAASAEEDKDATESTKESEATESTEEPEEPKKGGKKKKKKAEDVGKTAEPEAQESGDPADYKLTRSKYERTSRKISGILEIALRNGQQNLVLGAIGCGAFYNPPYDIAEIFRDQLNSPAFKGKFKRIVFAIPKSKWHKNHEIFAEVLAPAPVEAPEPTKTDQTETVTVGDIVIPVKAEPTPEPTPAEAAKAPKKKAKKVTAKIQSLAGPGYKPKLSDFPPLGS